VDDDGVGAVVEIRLLGRFSVSRAGHAVPTRAFGGRLAARLLRLLVARRGEYVSQDVLAEALWPGQRPADPAANLTVLVARARSALGDRGLIATGPGGYVFVADGEAWVDAEEFRELARAGRAHAAHGRNAAAAEVYERALALWGEPLAEDAYEDWARGPREELSRLHAEVLEGAAAVALARHDPARAVDLATVLVAAAPLRESGHLLLAQALARTGDQSGALAVLTAFRQRYAEELGLDPSPEVGDLTRRIVRGEVAPAGSTVPVASLAPARPEGFVGRDAQLAAVLAGLRAPRGVVVVVGAPGAGKSRLLAEAVRGQPLPTLSARAFLAERHLPLSVVRGLLGEAVARVPDIAAGLPSRIVYALVDVVPELAEGRPAQPHALDPQSRQALVVEGAVRLLGGLSQPLVCVDDLQWADATSLAVLHAAADRVPGLRLLLACRDGEVPEAFLAGLETGGEVVRVVLPPLSADAIGELVGDPELARVLAAETDRTPLAVTELVAALAGQGLVARDHGGAWVSRSDRTVEVAGRLARQGQRRSIRRRVAACPGEQAELAHLLALAGRELPARVLAAAVRQPLPEVLARLDGLVRGGIVRVGDHGFAPAHDVIGEALAEPFSPTERARLHGVLARALTAERADPAVVAEHLAGSGDRAGAAARYASAAAAALERTAVGDAERLVAAGLDLAGAEPVRARLLGVRAELAALHGDLAAARADLRTALAGLRSGPERAAVLARMAMLTSGAQDLEYAADLAELALVEAGRDPANRATALAVAAIIDMNRGEPARSRARAAEARRLFEQVGDTRGIAGVLDGEAMATFMDGRVRPAVAAFDRVARLFSESGELTRVITPRSTRGHGLVFAGSPGDGEAEVTEAFELAQQLGHAEGLTYTQWHLAEALAAQGDTDRALAAAREAHAVARRIEHRGWTATACRAVGIAREAVGDLDAAEAAYRDSLAASTGLGLFSSWAHARLGMVLLRRGRPADAEPQVRLALAGGPPLAHHEARLAAAELAAATGDPHAATVVDDALGRAQEAGYLAVVPRLRDLRATVAAPAPG
jgi:DNA-binding SARP family transcriptional activator